MASNSGSSARPRSFVSGDDKRARPLRLLIALLPLAILLAGCVASPEAVRVRGEPGADPGNHGNPVELLAPPDRFQRIFAGIPFEGPRVASEDTAET